MRTQLPPRIRYGVVEEIPGRIVVCQVVLWSLTDATCDKKGGHSYFGHIGRMPPDGSINAFTCGWIRRLELAAWSTLICLVDPPVQLCHIPNQPGNSKF